MKFLITGFDPFEGETINPAWQAVRQLPAEISHNPVVTALIPTVFQTSVEVLMHLAAQHRPDVVICVGQAGGRSEISLERIAINIDDTRIPDNQGQQPIDIPIYPQGDNAYFSNLPIKRIVASLRGIGIPSSVSNTAGTFVCNHLMYGLLYHINKKSISASYGGFVHIPFSPAQAAEKSGVPSMDISCVVKALYNIVETISNSVEDLRISGGTES